MTLIYGLIAGIIFGIFLQRARVIRFDKQIGALLLQDMTIVKFMFSAILVGMVGIYLLGDIGMLNVTARPLQMGGLIVGGALFGIGWSMLGYCPGTSVAAFAEGRLDALAGIVGMLVGAGLYAVSYPLLKDTLLSWANLGAISIPDLLGINHWFVIVVFVVGGILMFRFFEKQGL